MALSPPRSRVALKLPSARVELEATRWYWTLATYGRCDRCGLDVEGLIIAYESWTRAVLCPACADEAGVAAECQESKRAREARRARLIAEAESVPTLAGTAA